LGLISCISNSAHPHSHPHPHKNLVHELVNNQGLQCLINIGEASDQNYILRGRES